MPSSPRPGRPTGSSGNQVRILDAARSEFAACGFRDTSLRTVASQAGVDVALISHYFGNKDGLFAATLELPDRASGVLVAALEGDPATVGRRLTRGYLLLWEDPTTGPQMQALARSATNNIVAEQSLYKLLTGTAGGKQVAYLIDSRETAFALAMSSLFGISVNRYLMAHPALHSLDLDALIESVSPVIQHYFDQPPAPSPLEISNAV